MPTNSINSSYVTETISTNISTTTSRSTTPTIDGNKAKYSSDSSTKNLKKTSQTSIEQRNTQESSPKSLTSDITSNRATTRKCLIM